MKSSIVRILLPILLALILLGGPAVADTLILKSGKEYDGKVISDSGGVIKFKTSYGVLEFPKDQVDRIEEGLTRVDEYKKRLKKLDENDIEGRLALVRWCTENKLFSQRKQLIRTLTKLSPDHPGVRRENGQAWRDGKWVKVDDVKPLPVKAAKAGEIKGTRGKVAVPSGWERKDAAKSVTATGPNNYATAPVLTVEIIAETDPAKAFPESEGWAKPEPVAAAGLSGLKSRRKHVEDLIGKVEWLAVVSGSDYSVRFRLTCLECESEDYGPALGVALESLEFAAPPADYVNDRYGYQMNLPKPQDEWEKNEDEGQLVMVRRSGDAIDYALLMVLTAAPGEEADALRTLYDGIVGQMREGDVEKEEEITLSGEKASFLQTTHLEGGIPMRSVAIMVTHGKQACYIVFRGHEFGREKDGHSVKTILDSFRFTK